VGRRTLFEGEDEDGRRASRKGFDSTAWMLHFVFYRCAGRVWEALNAKEGTAVPAPFEVLATMRTKELVSLGCFLGIVIPLLVPLPLASQGIPGQPRSRDRWGVEQARFQALILERVNETMSKWQEAWDADDPEALTDTYSDFGILVLTGEKLTGKPEIEGYFQGALPSLGSVSFSLAEFTAGGSMAMMLGTLRYREDVAPNENREVTGQCLIVFVEESGAWKIRSQLFRPEPPS
jgi:ketosteroid isomerase-like protein